MFSTGFNQFKLFEAMNTLFIFNLTAAETFSMRQLLIRRTEIERQNISK